MYEDKKIRGIKRKLRRLFLDIDNQCDEILINNKIEYWELRLINNEFLDCLSLRIRNQVIQKLINKLFSLMSKYNLYFILLIYPDDLSGSKFIATNQLSEYELILEGNNEYMTSTLLSNKDNLLENNLSLPSEINYRGYRQEYIFPEEIAVYEVWVFSKSLEDKRAGK